MRRVWQENSPFRALDDAYQELTELGDEMRDAFERTPDQFKDNSGSQREVAADVLEAVLRPAIPASIDGDGHTIGWIEVQKGKDGRLFRPARRNNVVSCLKAVLAYASGVSDPSREMATFLNDTAIDIHNLETIEFPGMAGR